MLRGSARFLAYFCIQFHFIYYIPWFSYNTLILPICDTIIAACIPSISHLFPPLQALIVPLFTMILPCIQWEFQDPPEWRYHTICSAICWRFFPLHRPYMCISPLYPHRIHRPFLKLHRWCCRWPCWSREDAWWRPGGSAREAPGIWWKLMHCIGIENLVSSAKYVLWLVVWLPFFIFPLILRRIIPIDFHIFQRGSNHQPVLVFWMKSYMIAIYEFGWMYLWYV